MVVFVNSKGEIKDVGSTKQVDLVGIVLRDEENPFKDWSIAKICCYRIETFDGYVTMMTPYVDTRIIEHIDQLGKQVDNNTSGIQTNSVDIVTTQEGLAETYEETATSITQLEEALVEVYEIIVPKE